MKRSSSHSSPSLKQRERGASRPARSTLQSQNSSSPNPAAEDAGTAGLGGSGRMMKSRSARRVRSSSANENIDGARQRRRGSFDRKLLGSLPLWSSTSSAGGGGGGESSSDREPVRTSFKLDRASSKPMFEAEARQEIQNRVKIRDDMLVVELDRELAARSAQLQLSYDVDSMHNLIRDVCHSVCEPTLMVRVGHTVLGGEGRGVDVSVTKGFIVERDLTIDAVVRTILVPKFKLADLLEAHPNANVLLYAMLNDKRVVLNPNKPLWYYPFMRQKLTLQLVVDTVSVSSEASQNGAKDKESSEESIESLSDDVFMDVADFIGYESPRRKSPRVAPVVTAAKPASWARRRSSQQVLQESVALLRHLSDRATASGPPNRRPSQRSLRQDVLSHSSENLIETANKSVSAAAAAGVPRRQSYQDLLAPPSASDGRNKDLRQFSDGSNIVGRPRSSSMLGGTIIRQRSVRKLSVEELDGAQKVEKRKHQTEDIQALTRAFSSEARMSPQKHNSDRHDRSKQPLLEGSEAERSRRTLSGEGYRNTVRTGSDSMGARSRSGPTVRSGSGSLRPRSFSFSGIPEQVEIEVDFASRDFQGGSHHRVNEVGRTASSGRRERRASAPSSSASNSLTSSAHEATSKLPVLQEKAHEKNDSDVSTSTLAAAEQAHEAKRLIKAAGRGDLHRIRSLLKKKVDINSKDANAWSALHYAAYAGALDCVQYLLSHGALINATNNSLQTPLHKATEKGHLKCVKELIRKGADINARNKKGQTALYRAKAVGHTEVEQYLKEHGGTE